MRRTGRLASFTKSPGQNTGKTSSQRLRPGFVSRRGRTAWLVVSLLLSCAAANLPAQTVHFVGGRGWVNHNFNHPEGLAMDAQGNLYVADYYAKAVYEVLAVNGQIPANPTVNQLGSGFSGPTGVAVDASGNVYVADFAANAVKEIEAVGGTIPSSPNIRTWALFDGPQDLVVDASENVFVSAYYLGAVEEMLAVGGVIPASPTVNFVGSGFNAPFGLALDAAGNLWVADSGASDVKEVTEGSGYVTTRTFGSFSQPMAGGYYSPAGIAVDASGNVFVADTNHNAVKEILASGGYATTEVLNCCEYPPFGLVADARGNVYVADTDDGAIDEYTMAGVNYGTVNVGATSAEQDANFTFDNGGNAGSAVVFSNGAPSGDFAVTFDDCDDPSDIVLTANEQCQIGVTFTPTRPGYRYGTVELLNTSGNLMASGPVFGFGVGPQVGFPPGVTSILGSGWVWPDSAAVDGSGNIFVTDKDANAVKEIVAAGGYTTVKTVVSGLSHPVGVALDGAANLFITSEGDNTVKEALAFGGYATINTLGSGFLKPEGVAVDGSGNVYVADGGNSAVKQILAVNGSIPANPVILSLGSGWSWPEGVAVDINGNVYVADYNNTSIKEMIAANGAVPASPTINTLGSGFIEPDGVAVDASRNVYVADYGNSAVKEILAAGGYTTVETLIPSFPALSLALDASGDVYAPGNVQVLKLDLADAPSLTFPTTSVGSTSAPQTVIVENLGNATLSFPIPNEGSNPFVGENFNWNSAGGGACPLVTSGSANPATLAEGASCQIPITFAPKEAGNISDWLVLWDNALNAPGPAYTVQNVSLEGNGTKQVLPPTLVSSFAGASIPLNTTVVQSFTVANPNASTTLTGVTFLESLPAGLQVAASTANTCGGTLTAANGASSFGLTGVTLAGAQSCSINVTLTGVAAGLQTVATMVTSIEGGAGLTGNLSVTVVSPPAVTVSLTPATISVGGNAELLIQISNANTATNLSGVGFTGTLPAGLVLSPMNAEFNGSDFLCFGSTLTAVPGSTTFSLTGLELLAENQCQIYLFVTATATGQSTATIAAPTSNEGGPGAPASASVQVNSPPLFTVTTLADDPAGVAANCTDQSQPSAVPDSNCSLRDAIAQATVSAGNDITTGPGRFYFASIRPNIDFAAALTSGGAGTITLGTGGTLNANYSMSISGPGANLLTISGAGQYQVFNLGSTPNSQAVIAEITIADVTIANGTAGNGNGGAVSNSGDLLLSNVVLTGNSATNGGAIWNGDNLALINSSLTGNSATAAGGGLYNGYIETMTEIEIGDVVIGYNTDFNYGYATVIGSTISGNTAVAGTGGGLYNSALGVPGPCPGGICTTTTSNQTAPLLSVTNSTITANAAALGGGIYTLSPTAGYLVVNGSTITANSAATGGGVDVAAGSLAFQNDIAAGNSATASAPDFTGATSDGGGNMLGASSGSGASAAAGLAPLGNYGGPTQTMPPMQASATICAGVPANVPAGVTTDQRGNPRTTTNYGAQTCVDSGAVQTAYTIAFTTQPATVQLNQQLATAPVVGIYDNSVPIPLAGATISLAPASGTMSGSTTAQTDATGIATFSGLSFTQPVFGEQLDASLQIGAGSLPNQTAASSSFDVVTVDHIAVAAPATATAGTPVNATVTAYEDAAGTRVATFFTGMVSFSSSDAKAVLPSATALAAGTVTVPVTLETAGTETISASNQGATLTATSPQITVNAAAPARIVAVSGSGQTATIGAAFAQPLTVSVDDAYMNPVPGAQVTFTAPASGPSATFSTASPTSASGTTSVAATANGLAGKSAYTVTASVGGVVTPAGFTLTNAQAATTVSVAPGATALVYGQPVTVTAQIAPANVGATVPTGAIAFYDGAAALNPASTVANGAASYPIAVPLVGAHAFKAQYSGDSNFAQSAIATAASALTVSTASVTLAGTASPVTYGQSESITVTLTGAYTGAGIAVPGGSSTASYGIAPAGSKGSSSGSLTPTPGTTNSSVVIPVPSTLAAGSYTVSVSYAGDANYSVASLQIPLAISQAAQSINFSPPAPVTFGAAPITLSATGGASGDPVTFSVVSGPASLTGNVLTISGAGKVSLMASQAGNIDYAAASVALTIAVAKGTPQVSVSSSVNPVLVQNAVTLTATVSSAAGAPGGQVNFLSGSTPLGSGTISGGAATLVTSALATGSDSITAIYQGDTNFTTAASSVLTEVVADFTLAASNGTATANPGGKADFTLNIDPASGSTSFPSAVTLSVTGLPAGATAVFTPASVAEGAGATAVTLAVQIPQNSDLSRSGHDPGARNRGAGAIALALLMAPLALRRARKRLHRTLWLLVLVMTGTAAMLGVTGCGSTSGFFGDLSHSDTLTVTASSGPLSHSTNLTLTVKPQGD